ncbi:MAG: hypothetical protein M3450_20535 [Actinomycetota bacterium]|nr:hypothetical protein [Actinomycetota bacterium]
MSMWDTKSRAEHFDGDDRFYKGDANVVLVDLKTKAVTTTGMGRAIGDYARWLTPGCSARLPVTRNSQDLWINAPA